MHSNCIAIDHGSFMDLRVCLIVNLNMACALSLRIAINQPRVHITYGIILWMEESLLVPEYFILSIHKRNSAISEFSAYFVQMIGGGHKHIGSRTFFSIGASNSWYREIISFIYLIAEWYIIKRYSHLMRHSYSRVISVLSIQAENNEVALSKRLSMNLGTGESERPRSL